MTAQTKLASNKLAIASKTTTTTYSLLSACRYLRTMAIEIPKYRLFPSVRLFICLLCTIGVAINLAHFSSINFAWVCMVNDTPLHADNSSTITPAHHGQLLNWNKQVQRHIFAGFHMGGLITLFIGGPLVHRFGSKLVFGAGLTLATLATALIPLSTHVSYVLVAILRVFTGLGAAVMFPMIYEVLACWSAKPELGTLLAIMLGGMQLGGFSSLMLDGIECSHLPWEYIFYIVSGVAAPFLVVWFTCFSNDPVSSKRLLSEEEKLFILTKRNRTEKKKIPVPYKEIFKSLPVWSCFISSAANGYLGFLASYMPTYFKEVLNMDIQSNGFFSAIPWLAMLSGRWLSGPLSDKKYGFKSHEPVLKIFNTVAFIVPTIGLFGLTFVTEASPIYLIVIITFVMYFFGTFATGGFFKSPLYLAPQFSGIVGSMHMAANFAMALTQPYMVSALTPHGTAAEWHNVFYVCMVIEVAGALGFLIFGKAELQPWARDVQMSFQKPSTISIVTNYSEN